MFSICGNGLVESDGLGHEPGCKRFDRLHSATPSLSASWRLASGAAGSGSPSSFSIHVRASAPNLRCSACAASAGSAITSPDGQAGAGQVRGTKPRSGRSHRIFTPRGTSSSTSPGEPTTPDTT
eukprot:4475855-Prymnesium_polylepis.1